jgi:glutaredoxin
VASALPIVIYSRKECHLCDEAKAAVAPIAKSRGLAVEVIDIDRDPSLVAQFGLEVPVVFVNGRKAFKYRVDATKLESLLDRGVSA